MPRPRPQDRSKPAYVRRAQENYGVVGRDDLIRDGLDRHAIWRRVHSGALDQLLPRTYRVPGSPSCWEQDLAAALTWAGSDARASHRSAAALLHLDGFPKEVIEITTSRRLGNVEGVIVHHSEELHSYDVTEVDNLACTTTARTLLDLGQVCTEHELELALEDALRRRLTTVAALHWELRKQGTRGRRGTAALRRLMSSRDRGYVPTESALELEVDRFLRSLQKPPHSLRLPACERQHVVQTAGGRRRPDFAFVGQKVAVEAHSYRWHSGRGAWESDQRRDRALRAEGWEVLYVTKQDLTSRRDEVARDLVTALARRGWNAQTPELCD